jgi:hypothetical protein
LYVSSETQAQGVYMQTGKNFTKYDYKSDSGSSNILQSGSGNFYECTHSKYMKTEKLKYMLGLGLNECNTIVMPSALIHGIPNIGVQIVAYGFGF